MNKVTNWALITGGSSGIGLEFARQLATKGYHLVLVSNDGQLSTTAESLRAEYAVEIELIDVDLADVTGLQRVIDRINDPDRPIEILVNSAGFAVRDSLVAGDIDRQITAFAVMAEAVLKLSNTAAHIMTMRKHGRIINVASTSAWLFAGNYSALKRWVVVYTESLALELAGTGVSATVVCPSWVKTNFHRRSGVSRPNLPNWAWVSVETVVASALAASSRGKSRVVPTLRWKVAVFFLRHCEPLARRLSRRMVARRVAELERRHR